MYYSSSLPSMLTNFSLLLLLFSFFNTSYSARTLLDPTTAPPPTHHNNHHQPQPSMTFLIKDNLLTRTLTSTTSNTNIIPQVHLPFSKPLLTNNFNPPIFGTTPSSSPQTNPNQPNTQTLGITFPASTLQEELEFGSVTDIEEDMYNYKAVFGLALVGKAKGIYVAVGSEEGSSHMMAMTASLGVGNGKGGDEVDDSLRFFGVYKRDVEECHVAVIGGTGRFEGANGFATIRVVTSTEKESNYSQESSDEEAKRLLLYNVYLN